jgi:hypothetical protein
MPYNTCHYRTKPTRKVVYICKDAQEYDRIRKEELTRDLNAAIGFFLLLVVIFVAWVAWDVINFIKKEWL